mmetsp:Transcript_74312/g.198244  ORF Transcript_74312/g.198244 Transcript_74312/m.198244 type:complete len:294 (+) Transcript_74312:45-926(+)
MGRFSADSESCAVDIPSSEAPAVEEPMWAGCWQAESTGKAPVEGDMALSPRSETTVSTAASVQPDPVGRGPTEVEAKQPTERRTRFCDKVETVPAAEVCRSVAKSSKAGGSDEFSADEIIPGLFLSGLDVASSSAALRELGVTAVVCCVTHREFPPVSEHSGVEYYRVDVEDQSREPIDLYFEEICEFVTPRLEAGQKVLVHCRSGVSRSATVVLAFLMQYKKFSLQRAFFHTRARRIIISPNLGFMEQLQRYEKEYHGVGVSTVSRMKYEEWYMSSSRPAVPDLDADDSDDE